MNTKQKVALVGSAVLIVGVFFPIISAPLFGSISYFKNGEGDGTIVLILGIISAVLGALDLCGWLWITGLSALGITLFDFVRALQVLSEAKGQLHSSLNGNIFQGFADIAVSTIQLQWGWAVILLGGVLVTAGAAIRHPHEGQHEEPVYSEERSVALPVLLGFVGLCVLVWIGALLIEGGSQNSSIDVATEIRAKLSSDPALNRLNLQVGQNGNEITLTGTVPDYSARLQVYKLASSLGVGKKINDQLEVKTPAPESDEPGAIENAANDPEQGHTDPSSREQRLITAFCGNSRDVDDCVSRELPGMGRPLIPAPDFSDRKRFESAKEKCAPKFLDDNQMLVYCTATIYAGLSESQASP